MQVQVQVWMLLQLQQLHIETDSVPSASVSRSSVMENSIPEISKVFMRLTLP